MKASSIMAAVLVAGTLRLLAPKRAPMTCSAAGKLGAKARQRGTDHHRERVKARCREYRLLHGQPVEDALQEGRGA